MSTYKQFIKHSMSDLDASVSGARGPGVVTSNLAVLSCLLSQDLQITKLNWVAPHKLMNRFINLQWCGVTVTELTDQTNSVNASNDIDMVDLPLD